MQTRRLDMPQRRGGGHRVEFRGEPVQPEKEKTGALWVVSGHLSLSLYCVKGFESRLAKKA